MSSCQLQSGLDWVIVQLGVADVSFASLGACSTGMRVAAQLWCCAVWVVWHCGLDLSQ